MKCYTFSGFPNPVGSAAKTSLPRTMFSIGLQLFYARENFRIRILQRIPLRILLDEIQYDVEEFLFWREKKVVPHAYAGYISLTPSLWTSTMDYENGLPKWITSMNYLKNYPEKKTIEILPLGCLF